MAVSILINQYFHALFRVALHLKACSPNPYKFKVQGMQHETLSDRVYPAVVLTLDGLAPQGTQQSFKECQPSVPRGVRGMIPGGCSHTAHLAGPCI